MTNEQLIKSSLFFCMLSTLHVYKYIKNLRAKINEDILQNATKGGYRLNMP